MRDDTQRKAFEQTKKFAAILDMLEKEENTKIKTNTQELSKVFGEACLAFKKLTSDTDYLNDFHKQMLGPNISFNRPSDALAYALENWNEFISVERHILKETSLPTYLIDEICATISEVATFLPLLSAELDDTINFETFQRKLDEVKTRICNANSGLKYENRYHNQLDKSMAKLDITAGIIGHANLFGGLAYGDPFFTSSGAVATALWVRKTIKRKK